LPIFYLTKQGQKCTIAAVNNQILVYWQLGPARGGTTRWRFPRANGALRTSLSFHERDQGRGLKIGSISGCLWRLSQTPFSFPKQAQGATGFKKTLSLESKSGRQRLGQDKYSDTGVSLSCLEGLSFLMRSHSTGTPMHACFV